MESLFEKLKKKIMPRPYAHVEKNVEEMHKSGPIFDNRELEATLRETGNNQVPEESFYGKIREGVSAKEVWALLEKHRKTTLNPQGFRIRAFIHNGDVHLSMETLQGPNRTRMAHIWSRWMDAVERFHK